VGARRFKNLVFKLHVLVHFNAHCEVRDVCNGIVRKSLLSTISKSSITLFKFKLIWVSLSYSWVSFSSLTGCFTTLENLENSGIF